MPAVLRHYWFVFQVKDYVSKEDYKKFSSVQSLSHSTLWDPTNRSTPGLPVHHQLRSSLKLTSIKSVMPSSHLILCHPLLLLPPIPPSIRVFSFFFFQFYFIFKLYITVLDLPNVKMNPPQVYMCSPSWTLKWVNFSHVAAKVLEFQL